jgi:hypothetical protein
MRSSIRRGRGTRRTRRSIPALDRDHLTAAAAHFDVGDTIPLLDHVGDGRGGRAWRGAFGRVNDGSKCRGNRCGSRLHNSARSRRFGGGRRLGQRSELSSGLARRRDSSGQPGSRRRWHQRFEGGGHGQRFTMLSLARRISVTRRFRSSDTSVSGNGTVSA